MIIAIALAIPVGANAQKYDVLETVGADRCKLAGCEGPYRFEKNVQTPAPCGYRPVYISHYGRHGSRYAWNSQTYTLIHDVLDGAAQMGALTERGAKLRDDFNAFYRMPLINTGDLSELGWEQQARIGEELGKTFSKVFAKGGKAHAESSTAQRAIVSMNAFTVGLQKTAPKLVMEGSALHSSLPVTNNGAAPKELKINYSSDFHAPDTYYNVRRSLIDIEGILATIFTDDSMVGDEKQKVAFVSELYALWAGYHNYCDGDWMEDIFTQEQLLGLWEAENYTCYIVHSMYRYQNITLLGDIISHADEALAGGEYKAHFRFGHDTVFNSVCPLLNLGGSGFMPDKVEDVKYWFQNYDTPMAANLVFVLYKSKRSPDVLFKVLRNGREATMPQLVAVSGPYYRWEDFKQWVAELAQAHAAIRNWRQDL